MTLIPSFKCCIIKCSLFIPQCKNIFCTDFWKAQFSNFKPFSFLWTPWTQIYTSKKMKENVLKQQQSEVRIAQTFRIKFIWKKKCVIKGKKQKQPSLIARFTISLIIEERKKTPKQNHVGIRKCKLHVISCPQNGQ